MKKHSILLVEDNPNDEMLTLRALKKHGLANSVDVARDGAEAVDYLFCRGTHAERSARNMPQVVLLDLKLPKMSGLDVLKEIRQDPRTSLLPVVVLTTSDEDSDLARCYSLGANSYVRKPVDFLEFMEAVRQLGLYWLILNERPPMKIS